MSVNDADAPQPPTDQLLEKTSELERQQKEKVASAALKLEKEEAKEKAVSKRQSLIFPINSHRL